MKIRETPHGVWLEKGGQSFYLTFDEFDQVQAHRTERQIEALQAQIDAEMGELTYKGEKEL